jgi:Holliday junction resolvasome RuvABC endonuclease subunit
MKILSFDQSTRVTGWAVFENGEYLDSGVIDLSKNKDTDDRSKQMGLAICEVIKDVEPDEIVLEEVAQQSNVSTVIKLARIQGMTLGFAASMDMPTHILEPARWRSALGYSQGPKVKRAELKKQSADYVAEHFGFDYFSEDRNEAVAINAAAHKIFGWDWDSADDEWDD